MIFSGLVHVLKGKGVVSRGRCLWLSRCVLVRVPARASWRPTGWCAAAMWCAHVARSPAARRPGTADFRRITHSLDDIDKRKSPQPRHAHRSVDVGVRVPARRRRVWVL